MNIAYVRVSTKQQSTDRQYKTLEKYNIEKYYEEKISGKDTNRKQLKEMLDFVRKGDTIYIADFSRLGRNTKDLLDIIEYCNKKGVAVVSAKESFDTTTANGKLMITMLSAIYQFEREITLERQREGIEIAKEKGVYKGRKAIQIDSDIFDRYYEEYRNRKINKREFAERLAVSRPTLDKILKEKADVL
jgi:DNA invertase Pin-like site-specific DNA recombinase